MNGMLTREHSKLMSPPSGGRRRLQCLAPRGQMRLAPWPATAVPVIVALMVSATISRTGWIVPATPGLAVGLIAATVTSHRRFRRSPRPDLAKVEALLKLGATVVCTEVAIGQTTGLSARIPETAGLAVALAAVVATVRLQQLARCAPVSPWQPRPRSPAQRPHMPPPRLPEPNHRMRVTKHRRTDRGRANPPFPFHSGT